MVLLREGDSNTFLFEFIFESWRNMNGITRVCEKCFSFWNCRVILAGSEWYVVSKHYQEERRVRIKLINFVIFHRNFFFLCVQALRRLLERKHVFFFFVTDS